MTNVVDYPIHRISTVGLINAMLEVSTELNRREGDGLHLKPDARKRCAITLQEIGYNLIEYGNKLEYNTTIHS
jgi:hypothetical protein